ncbi:MAG TPA: acetylornithine deacetylase [Pyrinomonadaceae bacterium]|jgi:acetylornithine deacetylase|nr:acetylornithine deacetylase [Pyrinomonadaceae bacterium]
MKVEETLAQLVAIDSVSSRSNARMISYAAARAEAAGLRVNLYPYKDARGVEKINMIAHTARSASSVIEVELALVGHTDTVPFDANWTEALALTARDGQLYGRGACDTKGFIAAAITAIEGYEVKNLRRPVALVLTADEEVGCLGAKRLAEERAMTARYSIVGEPTSLQPIRAGKGYCLAEVVVRGREGHSAYPALGASAVFRAARLITRLENMAEALKGDRHDEFDPPHTTLNVGVVRGGTAKNIIAGECSFTLEWRPVPGQTASHVLDLLRASIEDERSREPDFDCEIVVSRIDEGMETPAGSTLVRLLEEATGKAAGTISFGTEAPDMQRLGAETVVLGPGDIRVAHRTGEFVPLAELQQCVSILARAIEHFCA